MILLLASETMRRVLPASIPMDTISCASIPVDTTPNPDKIPPVPNPAEGNIPNGNEAASALPEQWMIEVKNRVEKPPSIPNTDLQPTIFIVPDNLRSFDPPAYTPQLVSVGPYHHNTTFHENDISVSLRYYKSQCARILLCPDGTRDYSLMYQCLAMITNNLVPRIRRCYSNGVVPSTDHELAEMMLYDGCFIIRRLLGVHVHVDTQQGPLLGLLWIWHLVKYDMLKLENQIPFFVLEELFEFIKTHEINNALDGKDLIDLALDFVSDIGPPKSKSFKAEGTGKYHHLLHLFYSSLLPPHDPKKISENSNRPEDPRNPKSHGCWIPSATELGRAGVGFKENKREGSFLDVTFEHGVLEIPSLRITDYSNTLFRNLIAFEQCFPHTKCQVTAYAVFMDCLVDTARDVNLLDLQGILVNRLSTDEAVADLFNNLTCQVHYALDRNYLHDLFVTVNKYHQSRWHQDRAVLMRDYFSSPWSVISLIAATILIIFTALQTFYTVYPYYRPNS